MVGAALISIGSPGQSQRLIEPAPNLRFSFFAGPVPKTEITTSKSEREEQTKIGKGKKPSLLPQVFQTAFTETGYNRVAAFEDPFEAC
jgi:hypothetical protein